MGKVHHFMTGDKMKGFVCHECGFTTLQRRRRPDCIFSELNTHPAYPLSTLRCVPRGSSARLKAERIATPFSLGSFILYFKPV